MPSRSQQGSLTLRGKKEKVWYGTYRQDVRDADGHINRRQCKVRLGTREELPTRSAARDALAKILDDSHVTTVMTFEQLVCRWERAEESTRKPTSFRHYRNALRAYVTPVFGSKPIAEITREDIQLFLAKQAKRYSKSSLHSMKLVLGLTLGWAFDCGWIEKNPCVRTKLPRITGGRKIPRTVLTAEQVKALAEKLEEPYAT